MFGIDDAVVAAGVSAAGGMLGQSMANQANAASSGKAMRFQDSQARINREWQERMSNTAYQRATADMKAAGLNPILLASKGFSGASSPSGDSGSGSTYQSQDAIGKSVSSAMDAIRMRAELKNLEETNAKIRSDTDLNRALKLVADNDARIKASTAKVVASQVPGAMKEQQIDESKFGTVMRYLGRLNPFASSAGSLAKVFK